MHRLSRPIRAISDLTRPGVRRHRRCLSTRERGLHTAQCGRRISTFSLPSLDCLPRHSLGGGYRTPRSPSEWPSSLLFFSRTGARSRRPSLDSSLVSCPSPCLRYAITISQKGARFLYRSFTPCFSLRAMLFEYDPIRHLIDHRQFRVHC